MLMEPYEERREVGTSGTEVPCTPGVITHDMRRKAHLLHFYFCDSVSCEIAQHMGSRLREPLLPAASVEPGRRQRSILELYQARALTHHTRAPAPPTRTLRDALRVQRFARCLSPDERACAHVWRERGGLRRAARDSLAAQPAHPQLSLLSEMNLCAHPSHLTRASPALALARRRHRSPTPRGD